MEKERKEKGNRSESQREREREREREGMTRRNIPAVSQQLYELEILLA